MTDSEQPNVLLISVDSLRADYTSVFNDRETTTPFLDSLDATAFNHAISPSCWTLQVHSSIFTGLYPPEHGVLDKDRSLGPRPTLAELLSEAGYETRSFGYNGWLQAGDALRGFDHESTREITESRVGRVLKKLRHALFLHEIRDEFTVENCLDRLRSATDPFCYFVHLDDAHYIYTPKRPYHTTYTDASLVSKAYNLLQQRDLYDHRGEVYVGERQPSEGMVETTKAMYRGCIRQEDDLIRRLFEGLEATGTLDDTVVILFGDHGDNFGEDGVYGHQFSVADTLIRVPLVVFDPTGRLTHGTDSRVVQLNDLYPTVLDYCGVQPPESRSVSLLDDEERETAFTYYSAAESFVDRLRTQVDVADLPPRRQYVAWRGPDRKAVYYPGESRWADGSDETLQRELLDHLTSLSETDARSDGDIEDDVRSNLKQMGYL